MFSAMSRKRTAMPSTLELMNAKPRRLSKADALAINQAARQNMVQEIAELEQRASDLGVFVTARALNNAKNAL